MSYEELRRAVDLLVYRHRSICGYQLALWPAGADEPVLLASGTTVGRQSMSDETLHQTWCATKPVLAIGAVIASRQSQIDLAAPVSGFCHRFPAFAGNPATMWDVLCHDAGLSWPSATDLWMSPREDRARILAAATWSPDRMAAYSEIVGWAVLSNAIDAAGRGSAVDLANVVLALAGIQRGDLCIGRAWSSGVASSRNVGVYFADVGDGRAPLPLLHDHIPHVIESASPVLGGLVTARGLCRLYRATMRVPAISDATSAMLAIRRGDEDDWTLHRRCDFAAGFMVDLQQHGFGDRAGSHAYGHTGWLGASFGFADPERHLAVGFLHNGFVGPEVNDPLRSDLVDLFADWQ